MKEMIKVFALLGIGAYAGSKFSILAVTQGFCHPREERLKKSVTNFVKKMYEADPEFYEKLFISVIVQDKMKDKIDEELAQE